MFHISSNGASSLRSQASARQAAPSYFVVMLDYGKRGREAIVDPEITRREVISRIQSGEYKMEAISFIHHIDGAEVLNVTDEILHDVCRQQAAE